MGEMGRAFDGSYAEKVLLPNDQVYPVSTDLDWATLATLPETYYTAFGSMLNLKVNDRDTILVRGGASGVGIAFLKEVKAHFPHLPVAGTTRNMAKKADLLKQGYDQVVADVNGQLQTDRHYSKILELIGPKTLKDSFAHLNEGGIICSTGELGDQWDINGFEPISEMAPNSYLTSFDSANVNEERLKQMLDYVAHYHVAAKPVKIFSLAQVPAAHRYLESKHGFGKVIVLE